MKNELFIKFLNQYYLDIRTEKLKSVPLEQFIVIDGWDELFAFANAASFNCGVYRIINLEDVQFWKGAITSVFPKFSERIIPFGYDWLGRFFALDKGRMERGQPLTLLFSPFTNEVLELPAGIIDFHNSILVDQCEPALERSLFKSFLQDRKLAGIDHDVCVDLTVPLYLGGKFNIDNMNIMDLKQYWQITSAIVSQIEELPVGTSIRNVALKKGN